MRNLSKNPKLVAETIYLCRECDAVYSVKPRWCQECSAGSRAPFRYFKGVVTFDLNSKEGS